ncbi:MAG TPA: TIGR03668 family PPOX class F420-dependent oxidoreductase [Candidatus Limnocylindrales bacterium]|nr:TIGR03668 family PPOX class F420-dependent oxidoreductase [Candidatus Limnocylindrales bacterium]
MLTEREENFIRSHRIAHMATADQTGKPHVVPICYAYEGGFLYSVIDEKPKKVAPYKLRRVRNIEINPQVALVIDDYNEDWSRLGFVLIQGNAQILSMGTEQQRAIKLLREKYPQYQTMALEDKPVIKITPISVKSWGAV